MSLHSADFDLAALRALFNACREEGVMQFQSPEVSFVLGPKPVAPPKAETIAPIDPEAATDEALFGVGQAT